MNIFINPTKKCFLKNLINFNEFVKLCLQVFIPRNLKVFFRIFYRTCTNQQTKHHTTYKLENYNINKHWCVARKFKYYSLNTSHHHTPTYYAALSTQNNQHTHSHTHNKNVCTQMFFVVLEDDYNMKYIMNKQKKKLISKLIEN